MTQSTSISLIVGSLLLLLVSQVHSLICDNSEDVAIADACYKLDEQLQYALLQDKGNLHRLRKAFFYAPNARPVLLRVIYNVTYAENATLRAAYCTNDTNSGNELSINDTIITLGWTSTGVFTVFHPLTINFMQIQVPFVLMTVLYHIFNAINPEGSGPEAATFLWNGGYDLPTLRLNLHFTYLTCIPSEDLFSSVVNDFNSLLRIYAGREITGIIQDDENTRFVGFSLPSSSVSSDHTTAESDFWLYIVYVLSTFALYVVCTTTLFLIVSKSEQNGIKSFIKDNPEVLTATTTVISSFIIVEILAELVMAIIWTVNVKHHFIGFTVFAAAIAYYGPGVFSVYKILEKHCLCYKKGNEVTENYSNDSDDTSFKCFVWITAYFMYVILYSFFPAFVLAFAYPTRVITIFAFMATFLVSAIVYFTTYLKKDLTLEICGRPITGFKKYIFSIIIIILLLYFFLLIFALLYSLVIGRASVVDSAPLALLSLLPSILISIAAWVMKSTMLKNDNDVNNHGKKRDEKGTDEENQDGVSVQDKDSEGAGQNEDSEVQPAKVVPDNEKELA